MGFLLRCVYYISFLDCTSMTRNEKKPLLSYAFCPAVPERLVAVPTGLHCEQVSAGFSQSYPQWRPLTSLPSTALFRVRQRYFALANLPDRRSVKAESMGSVISSSELQIEGTSEDNGLRVHWL